MHRLSPDDNHRILIIDDNPAIHEDIKQILGRSSSSELEVVSAALFGESMASPASLDYEIDSAYQGQEGLAKVISAVQHQRPYAMGFVDMRMPPGWDGLKTIEQMWQADPELQIVICTAYSDYSWSEISTRLGATDQLLILKKPFDLIEVRQLAATLTRKWTLARQARQRLDALDAAVAERTRELAEANARLDLLDHLKTDFLTFISHELRTPLNAMVAIDWLDPHGDPQEQAEAISLVRSGHERLEGLVTKGLAYFEWLATEEVETSEMTDLAKVIRLAAERLSSGMESETQVSLSAPDVPCLVLGEAQHLMEVVQILLDNAVKFSGAEKEIKVDIHVTAQEVTLTVIDRGQGFPPKWASELFRPFTIPNMTYHSQGTGLNLALAYAIVKAYGGQLWTESEGVGLGATFNATFPAVPPT